MLNRNIQNACDIQCIPMHIDDVLALDPRQLSYEQNEHCLYLLQQETNRIMAEMSLKLAA